MKKGNQISFVAIDEYPELNSPEAAKLQELMSKTAKEGFEIMSKISEKSYLVFASNEQEVIKLMTQIEIKTFADFADIKQLAYLGMPIFCCLKEHQMKYIPFSLLDRAFENYANQPRFTKIRENYQNRKNFIRAKHSLLLQLESLLNNLTGLKKILKYVKKMFTIKK